MDQKNSITKATVGILRKEPLKRLTRRRRIADSFQCPVEGKIRIAFIDADGTIRVAPSGNPSANHPEDVAMLPMISGPLKRLQKKGYLLAIVSNQAGVQYGHVTLKDAEKALLLCIQNLENLGVTIHYFDFAEEKDENRKPDLGMAKRLANAIIRKFSREVDWKKTIMVGDSGWKKGIDDEPDGTPGADISNADRLFAENVAAHFGGCKYFHPRDFFNWKKAGVKAFHDYRALKEFLTLQPGRKIRW